MRNNINNIGVIGYKNQASKIINILKKKKFNLYIYVKNKKKFVNKKNIKYIEDLNLLGKCCSAIFIASPSTTHFKYITYFAKEKNLNLLSKEDLVNLLYRFKGKIDYSILYIKWFGIKSNFIVIGKKKKN